jgi:DNA repair exonuclease SbcCD ATPase subunit
LQKLNELEEKARESQNATAVIEILDHEILTFQREIDGLDNTIEQAKERMRLKRENLREKMQKSKALVDRGVEIENAVWEARRLESSLDEISRRIQEATWKDKERRELESKMALLEGQIEGDLKVLSEKIGLLDNQASILDQRPPACAIDSCLFIQSAVQARSSIEKYRLRKETIEKGEDEKSKKLAGLSDEHERISAEILSSGMDLKALNDEKVEIERRLGEVNKIAGLDPLLKDAEENLRILEAEENDLQRDYVDFLAETQKKRDEYVVQMEDRTSKRKECASKIDEEAISEKKRVEEAQEGLKEEMERCRDEMAKLKISESVLMEKAKTRDELLELRERIGSKIEMIDREITDWTYLRNACSKTGIQALEIDAAAPAISGIANDLLYATFGSKYQIKFQTVDDKGREVFNVQILDSETGELQDLDNLSGGQRVWVLKAIRLALTTLSKQKTGMDFRTIYADEEDGSLDLDRKLDYVNMHRELLRLGGFDTCFLISHTPEVVNVCDTVLNFNRGGVEIVSN